MYYFDHEIMMKSGNAYILLNTLFNLLMHRFAAKQVITAFRKRHLLEVKK